MAAAVAAAVNGHSAARRSASQGDAISSALAAASGGTLASASPHSQIPFVQACTELPTANPGRRTDEEDGGSSMLSSIDLPLRYGPATTTGQMRPLMAERSFAAAGSTMK